MNASSPTTQSSRDLHGVEAFRGLVGERRKACERLVGIHGSRDPLLMKIAPDMSDAEIDVMAKVLIDSSIDGVFATNATLDRDAVVSDPRHGASGGLSSRPLL